MIKIEAYQCEYCTKHRKGTGKPIRISRRKDTIYSHEHRCHYNPKNQTCLTCQKAVYKTTKEPECDSYNYPGEHVGTFAVFDHKYIRIDCPHWQAKESEVEHDGITTTLCNKKRR